MTISTKLLDLNVIIGAKYTEELNEHCDLNIVIKGRFLLHV